MPSNILFLSLFCLMVSSNALVVHSEELKPVSSDRNISFVIGPLAPDELENPASERPTYNCIKPDDPFCRISATATRISATTNNRKPVIMDKLEIQMDVSYHNIINGRNDSLHFSTSNSGQSSIVISTNQAVGGVAKIRVRGLKYGSWTAWETGSYNFSGINPSKKQIRDRIGNEVFAAASYVSCNKTGSPFHMFMYGGPSYVNYPSAPKYRFGPMCILNPSIPQLWNWKRSITAGIAEYNRIYNEAKKYPSILRAQGHNVRDFSEKELVLEFYQLISASRGYGIYGKHYWKPDDDKESDGWEKVVDEDKEMSGDVCLRVEKLVKEGHPPPGWDSSPNHSKSIAEKPAKKNN